MSETDSSESKTKNIIKFQKKLNPLAKVAWSAFSGFHYRTHGARIWQSIEKHSLRLSYSSLRHSYAERHRARYYCTSMIRANNSCCSMFAVNNISPQGPPARVMAVRLCLCPFEWSPREYVAIDQSCCWRASALNYGYFIILSHLWCIVLF
jgi:hypothetical protein